MSFYEQKLSAPNWQTRLWAIALLLIPTLFLLPITHDAVWQIWIGRQILHGAELYQDIIEVNPPLWFWIAVPLAWLGEALAIEARLVVVGFFTAAIGLSLYLSPARHRLLMLAAMAVLPLPSFGQREHFTLIATLPYLFLIGARADGNEVRHPRLIGALAAFGFALKPHFVIIPVLLEAFVLAHPRSRPEIWSLGILAVVYLTAVLLFTPTYLTDIVPMIRDAYASFQGRSTLPLLLGTFSLAIVGIALGQRRGHTISRILIVSAIGFLAAVLMQNKGWDYHSIPARGCLFLALAIELWRQRANAVADGFLFASALLCFHPFGVYSNPFRAEAERHMVGMPPGSKIALIGTNPMMAWPMVEEQHLTWSSSLMCLWPLNAVVFDGRGDLWEPLRRTVAKDLRRQPDILLVDGRRRLGPAAASLIPNEYLANYTLNLRTLNMVSYTLKSRSTEQKTALGN